MIVAVVVVVAEAVEESSAVRFSLAVQRHTILSVTRYYEGLE